MDDFATNSCGMPTHICEADAQSTPMTAVTGTDDSATNHSAGCRTTNQQQTAAAPGAGYGGGQFSDGGRGVLQNFIKQILAEIPDLRRR
jgi:hypothetical protein